MIKPTRPDKKKGYIQHIGRCESEMSQICKDSPATVRILLTFIITLKVPQSPALVPALGELISEVGRAANRKINPEQCGSYWEAILYPCGSLDLGRLVIVAATSKHGLWLHKITGYHEFLLDSYRKGDALSAAAWMFQDRGGK